MIIAMKYRSLSDAVHFIRILPVNSYDFAYHQITIFRCTVSRRTKKVCTKKSADSVSVIVMNPQNGELMAMVNYPEFDLNDPFTLAGDTGESVSAEEKTESVE